MTWFKCINMNKKMLTRKATTKATSKPKLSVNETVDIKRWKFKHLRFTRFNTFVDGQASRHWRWVRPRPLCRLQRRRCRPWGRYVEGGRTSPLSIRVRACRWGWARLLRDLIFTISFSACMRTWMLQNVLLVVFTDRKRKIKYKMHSLYSKSTLTDHQVKDWDKINFKTTIVNRIIWYKYNKKWIEYDLICYIVFVPILKQQ